MTFNSRSNIRKGKVQSEINGSKFYCTKDDLNGYLYYKQEQVALADWYFRRSLDYDSDWEGSQELHKSAQIYWKKGEQKRFVFLWKHYIVSRKKKEK